MREEALRSFKIGMISCKEKNVFKGKRIQALRSMKLKSIRRKLYLRTTSPPQVFLFCMFLSVSLHRRGKQGQ